MPPNRRLDCESAYGAEPYRQASGAGLEGFARWNGTMAIGNHFVAEVQRMRVGI